MLLPSWRNSGFVLQFSLPRIPVGARWARRSAGDWRVAAPEVGTWVCRLFREAVSAGCAWVQLLCSWGWVGTVRGSDFASSVVCFADTAL